MGATVRNGQAVGAGDKHRAAECVGNTVTLFMVLAAALTAVLLVSVRGIVAAVSTPEAAVEGQSGISRCALSAFRLSRLIIPSVDKSIHA